MQSASTPPSYPGYILIVVLGALFWLAKFLVRRKDEENRRRAEGEALRKRQEAEETTRRERHRAALEACRQQMDVLADQSIGLFESIPGHVTTAERHLDRAEIDFHDGLFAPFWDSVERAAETLGRFDESVRQINGNLSRYTELVKQYEPVAPKFPLSFQSVKRLSVGSATAERMKGIVRNAQRDFKFAMIYEQRKTNQILIAGFTSLAQVLEQMTWRITTSIDDLAGSVNLMGATLSKSVLSVSARVGEMAEATAKTSEQASKDASKRTSREEKVVEILDNIQRNRRPFP